MWFDGFKSVFWNPGCWEFRVGGVSIKNETSCSCQTAEAERVCSNLFLDAAAFVFFLREMF